MTGCVRTLFIRTADMKYSSHSPDFSIVISGNNPAINFVHAPMKFGYPSTLDAIFKPIVSKFRGEVSMVDGYSYNPIFFIYWISHLDFVAAPRRVMPMSALSLRCRSGIFLCVTLRLNLISLDRFSYTQPQSSFTTSSSIHLHSFQVLYYGLPHASCMWSE